jgi:hypothetical protein
LTTCAATIEGLAFTAAPLDPPRWAVLAVKLDLCVPPCPDAKVGGSSWRRSGQRLIMQQRPDLLDASASEALLRVFHLLTGISRGLQPGWTRGA